MTGAGAFYRPGTIRPPRPPRRGGAMRRAVLGGVALALVLGSAAAAWAAVRRHPRFLVRRVVLTGVPEPHRHEVEALSDPWIGRPLLGVDLDTAVAGLSSKAWVAHVAARRVVPDTIALHVDPRAPVALARKGEELWTVDQDGRWLAPYAGAPGSARLAVVDPAGAPTPEEGTAAGARLLVRMRERDPELLTRVSEVEVLADGFALVDVPARLRVLVGSDALERDAAFARWRAFLALAPELGRHGLLPREVDLRYENRIVLRAPAADGVRGAT